MEKLTVFWLIWSNTIYFVYVFDKLYYSLPERTLLMPKFVLLISLSYLAFPQLLSPADLLNIDHRDLSFSWSIDQSLGRSTDKYFSRSTDQYFSRLTDKYFSRSTDQYVSRSTDQYFSRSTDQYFSRSIVQSFSRPIHNFLII